MPKTQTFHWKRQGNREAHNAYSAIHWWVKYHWGKPEMCEELACPKRSHKYQWANLSGNYLKKRSDWKQLCVSCHKRMDMGIEPGVCKNGHPLTEDNTYRYKDIILGSCKTCRREAVRRSMAKRKAVA